MTRLLAAILGPAIWALHFAFLYGAATLACAHGAPDVFWWLALIATLLAAAGLAALLTRGDPFLRRLTRLLAALSLLAVAWAGGAALLLPACA